MPNSPLGAIEYKWTRRVNEMILIEQRSLLLEAGLRNLVRTLELNVPVRYIERIQLELGAAYELLGEDVGEDNA